TVARRFSFFIAAVAAAMWASIRSSCSCGLRYTTVLAGLVGRAFMQKFLNHFQMPPKRAAPCQQPLLPCVAQLAARVFIIQQTDQLLLQFVRVLYFQRADAFLQLANGG